MVDVGAQLAQKQQEINQANQAISNLRSQVYGMDPRAAANLPKYSIQQLQNFSYVQRQQLATNQINQNMSAKQAALAALDKSQSDIKSQEAELSKLKKEYEDYQNALIEQKNEAESYNLARSAAYGGASPEAILNLPDEQKDYYNAIRELKAQEELQKEKLKEFENKLGNLSTVGVNVQSTKEGYNVSVPGDFKTQSQDIANTLSDLGFNLESTKEGYIIAGSKVGYAPKPKVETIAPFIKPSYQYEIAPQENTQTLSSLVGKMNIPTMFGFSVPVGKTLSAWTTGAERFGAESKAILTNAIKTDAELLGRINIPTVVKGDISLSDIGNATAKSASLVINPVRENLNEVDSYIKGLREARDKRSASNQSGFLNSINAPAEKLLNNPEKILDTPRYLAGKADAASKSLMPGLYGSTEKFLATTPYLPSTLRSTEALTTDLFRYVAAGPLMQPTSSFLGRPTPTVNKAASEDKIKYYTGTSKENVDSILKEGLQPKEVFNSMGGFGKKNVHITTSYDTAKLYARQGGKVLELNLNSAQIGQLQPIFGVPNAYNYPGMIPPGQIRISKSPLVNIRPSYSPKTLTGWENIIYASDRIKIEKPKVDLVKGNTAIKAKQEVIVFGNLNVAQKELIESAERTYKAVIGEGKDKTVTFLFEKSGTKGSPDSSIGERTFSGYTKDNKGKIIDIFTGRSIESISDSVSQIQTRYLSGLRDKNVFLINTLEKVQTVKETPFVPYLSKEWSYGAIKTPEDLNIIISTQMQKKVYSLGESRQVSSEMLKKSDIDFRISSDPFYKKSGSSVFFPKGELPIESEQFSKRFTKATNPQYSASVMDVRTGSFIQEITPYKSDSLVFFREKGKIKNYIKPIKNRPNSPWNIKETTLTSKNSINQPSPFNGKPIEAKPDIYSTSQDLGGLQRETSLYSAKGSPLSNVASDIARIGFEKSLQMKATPTRIYFGNPTKTSPIQIESARPAFSIKGNVNFIQSAQSSERLVEAPSASLKWADSFSPREQIRERPNLGSLYISKVDESLKISQGVKQQQITNTAQVQRQPNRPTSIILQPERTKVPRPIRVTLPRPEASSKSTIRNLRPKIKGYRAEVRRRGKFKALGNTAMPYSEAFALGARRTINTAAASFRVKETSGPIISRGISLASSAARLFSPSRRETGVFVQRRESRIKSRGEILEIQRAGAATRRRATPTIKNRRNIFF